MGVPPCPKLNGTSVLPEAIAAQLQVHHTALLSSLGLMEKNGNFRSKNKMKTYLDTVDALGFGGALMYKVNLKEENKIMHVAIK